MLRDIFTIRCSIPEDHDEDAATAGQTAVIGTCPVLRTRSDLSTYSWEDGSSVPEDFAILLEGRKSHRTSIYSQFVTSHKCGST